MRESSRGFTAGPDLLFGLMRLFRELQAVLVGGGGGVELFKFTLKTRDLLPHACMHAHAMIHGY